MISFIVSAKNRDSQKLGYCKRLFKFDQPSESMVSDYDICICARVGVASTYLDFGDFFDTKMISKVSDSVFFVHFLEGKIYA